MLEAVLALATLARRVQLDAVPGHRVETYVTVTLRPRGGMPMLLSQRPPHLATAARIPAAQASLSTPVIELNQGLALE
jgi:hypothetical protein